MNEDILDDIDLLENEVEKEGNLFPFVLLILGLCILPFFPPFNWINFIIGSCFLLINFSLIRYKRKTGIVFTGFLCIFASINLINFFPFEIIAFGTSNTLGFDFISTLIFLGSYVLLNENIFLNFRHQFVQNNAVNYKANSKVNFFKKRFENRSLEELKSILDNPSMVEDAKKAAAELLETKSKCESRAKI